MLSIPIEARENSKRLTAAFWCALTLLILTAAANATATALNGDSMRQNNINAAIRSMDASQYAWYSVIRTAIAAALLFWFWPRAIKLRKRRNVPLWLPFAFEQPAHYVVPYLLVFTVPLRVYYAAENLAAYYEFSMPLEAPLGVVCAGACGILLANSMLWWHYCCLLKD